MGPRLHRLSNGVRVVADPMPGLRSAAIGVWVSAGAMDEGPHENGFAHLLEHMAFKGTRRRSARAIAEEIEAVGGSLNAATGYQHTGYYARLLSEDLGLAFDILADILREPTLEDAELEREKGVVLQEIGEARDTPDDVVFDLLQAQIFKDQPLGRCILGDEASVSAATRDALAAFMARRYEANGMVIAVAGGIDPDAVNLMAERYFGDIEPATRPGEPIFPRATPVMTAGVRCEPRDLEQTHIAFAMPGAAQRSDAYFASILFTEILGGGMASRLFQKVREEEGLAYSVYAYSDAYDDVGAIGVYLGSDAGNAARATRLCRGEIAALADRVDQEELDRARAMLRAGRLMALESPMSRAERAAGQLLTYDRLWSTAEILAGLEAVTVDDVAACARTAISAAPGLAVVGPGDFGEITRMLRGV